jgi:hypothetical protein
LEKNVTTIKNNAEILLQASKEVGLEVYYNKAREEEKRPLGIPGMDGRII